MRSVIAEATTVSVAKATGDGRRITGVEHTEDIVFNPRVNRCLINFIRVSSSASRLFDVEIFDKDDYAEVQSVYKKENNNRLIVTKQEFRYTDESALNKIYVKITNKDIRNASTFTIKILGDDMETN